MATASSRAEDASRSRRGRVHGWIEWASDAMIREKPRLGGRKFWLEFAFFAQTMDPGHCCPICDYLLLAVNVSRVY